MMKISAGLVLGSMMVVAMAVPAYAAAATPTMPPTKLPCVSTPNGTRRCPKAPPPVIRPVSFGAR